MGNLPDMTTGTRKRRRPRRLLFAAGVIGALLGLLAFFLPWLLKRAIERNSEAWIGRRITIDRIVLNPFTLTYGIHGFTCREPGSDAVFVSWDEVSVRAHLLRSWRSKAWRFHHLVIDKPYFHITQQGDRFNFSDLIELAGTEEETVTDPADTVPVIFSLEDIRIREGGIDYSSDLLHEPASITGLHADCTRITSQSARMDFSLGGALASGGTLEGEFTIDTEASRYGVKADLDQVQLAPLLPYLQDFMNTTELKGALDLQVDLVDSWADTTSLACRGTLDLMDLMIADGDGQPLIGCASAHCELDTLNARAGSFELRTIAIDGFTTRYELFNDGSDTWSKTLKLAGDTAAGDTTPAIEASESNVLVMLADYVRLLGEEVIANEYSADSVMVTNSSVRFNDYTPELPFRYTIDQLSIRSTRFGTGSPGDSAGVGFVTEARLNGKGRLNGRMDLDPHDFRNVDMDLEVTDLALQDLDAYSRWYAAHPLMDGECTYTTHTSVQRGLLDSQNALHIDRLSFGKKGGAHAEGIYLLPLRLAAGLLKDAKGVVNLDVPVKGDLNDPEFKVWPIVWQILKNLVVKAATAPVKLIQGVVGGEEKDLEQVRSAMLQRTLGPPQRRALDQLAAALKAKPDIAVVLVPLVDTVQEREMLAAFEAKRSSLGMSGALNGQDSARIDALSLRDSTFIGFLDARSPDTRGRPDTERCMAVAGREAIDALWADMERSRQEQVLGVLLDTHALPADRVTLRKGTADEVGGRTGVPGYRFLYDAAP